MTDLSGQRVRQQSSAQVLRQIDACAKRPIDLWTNYVCYPLSIRIVYVVRNARAISPNGITLFSLLLALAGCALFAVGTQSATVAGLVLVQVSYVFDCADGQLARWRRQYSAIGGWLDQIADRVKEFAIYFSLALGFARIHPHHAGVWGFAMIDLFCLYVLEYYGQVPMFRTPANAAPAGVPDPALANGGQPLAQPGETRFQRAQRWRSAVPFRGFIIGEQYFILLVFVALGLVYPLFVFVALLGLLMCVYRPVVQTLKHRQLSRQGSP